MGEYGRDYPSYTQDQMPPTAPGVPTTNQHRFDNYIMPSAQSGKPVALQGGVTEYGARTQIQNGIMDNTARTARSTPLQGNIQDGQLSTGINDSGGIPTYCLRIEDNQRGLDRDVFYSPLTGRVYHNVFIKQSDYNVVMKAKAQGTREQVNLYDTTGHLIQPVLAGAVGGWFTVDYQPSTVVLNIYDSPSINNGHSASQIPQELKQKFNKFKPFIQRVLNEIR
jgi:hypothetical protein